jgi:hypothetical protein
VVRMTARRAVARTSCHVWTGLISLLPCEM